MRPCARSRLSAHYRRRGAGLATGDKVGQQSPYAHFYLVGALGKNSRYVSRIRAKIGHSRGGFRLSSGFQAPHVGLNVC